MKTAVFERFSDLIYRKCGIVLTADKMSLLVGRIQKRLRARSIASELEYLEIIESDQSGQELIQLLDAVSTNTTHFWREAEHFQVFAQILEQRRKDSVEKTRIWCAASSSGQEPYTLAMEVLEHLPPSKHDVLILATDISTKVLRLAQAGQYSSQAISNLPLDKQRRFFRPVACDEDTEAIHQVIPEVQKLLTFKRLNLIEFPYPLKGPIDIIFCRNVMIYFDLPTRQSIINEFVRLLAPGGYLFLSLAESLLGIEHSFKRTSSSVYQKVV